MSKLIASFALFAVLSVCGCNHMDHHDKDMDSSEPKKMSVDACPHCPGVQTATADGRCPECGAKVK